MAYTKHTWETGDVITSERLNALENELERLSRLADTSGFPNEAKQALLMLLEHVAYIDDGGQTYHDALEAALYSHSALLSISAVFTQGQAVIYDSDSLDDLRQYLVVTANYSDNTTATVTDYTLSGTLAVGTSTITATWKGKSDTFNVVVSEALLYSLYNHTFANANPIATGLSLLSNDRDISIAFDVDFAGQQSNTIWKLMAIIQPSGQYQGLTVQAADQSGNSMIIQNMADKTIVNSNMRSFVGNFKYIVTHSNGSGQWHYYYKIGSNAVVDANVSSAFASSIGQLTIGGTASGAQVFNGTVNKCEVHGRVLSSGEINAFMGA